MVKILIKTRSNMNNFMEAPKTIFVNYLGYGCFDEPDIERMFASQIEYVRKDAFIEEVCKYISCHQCEYIDFDDLKKYMEDCYDKENA